MTLRDALDFALTSLRGNLAKSLLTVLGLGVGVGAVLTVLSLGDAGEIRVEEEIARLGVDKVWFCAENPAYPLTEDCRAIAASTGADVCLGASTMDAVSLGGQTVYAQIAGYDDGLETVHHPSSVQGRMFTAREYSGERVALLDETLAGRLNAAVGDFINCGGRRYCIVGVVAGMPAQSASLGSGMLLLPLQTWQDAYALAPTELALPTLFLQPAVRTLAQCLLMMSLFLSIAGSAQLAARFLTSSCQKPKKRVPYALIGLLTLTQLFDISRLWRVLTAFTAWSLAPGVLLLLVLTIARLCRREKA